MINPSIDFPVMESPPKYTLRPYQQKAVDAAKNYLTDPKQVKPVLLVMPTGSGKSLILTEIAQRLDAPLIIFQPTKEILEQNLNKLNEYNTFGVTVYSASMNQKEIGDITLATIGSVYRNPGAFKVFKYIIIDECDNVNPKGGMYKTFLDVVGEKVIGLTATPIRMNTDGFGGTMMKFITRTQPKVFSKVIHVTQTKELFDQGYLAKTEYFPIKGFTRSEIKLNSTGADYDEPSERQYYDKTHFSEKIIKVVNRLLEIGKTRILIFTKFVEEARELSEKLGSVAAIVNCEMKSSERSAIIKGFKSGDIKVVLNVGILTVGFDYPELEVVLIARPTRSLRLFYQMVGRCLRPHPSKEKAMVVDMCGNIEIFGKIEDMKLVEDGGSNLWCIVSNGKKLTNVYLDSIMRD